MQLIKSHGSRNEIFIADVRPDSGAADFVRRVCDRSSWTGGGDGVYFYEANQAWFYNPDGAAAEFCGNGMRCLGRHLLDLRGTDTETITSGSSTYTIRRTPSVSGVRQVALESPSLSFITGAPHPFEDFTSVAVPNPHVVALVEKYSEPDLVTYGELAPSVFPEGANVSFLLPLATGTPPTTGEVFVRTYERGAGLTPSCGSGAVASRAVYSLVTGIDPGRKVLVRNAGGVARSWIDVRDGTWYPVLEGNATIIFRAEADPAGNMLSAPAYATDEASAYEALEAENTQRLHSAGIQ
jgi:diaminopimelate epimerase